MQPPVLIIEEYERERAVSRAGIGHPTHGANSIFAGM